MWGLVYCYSIVIKLLMQIVILQGSFNICGRTYLLKTMIYTVTTYQVGKLTCNWMFVFPSPRPFAWPPALAPNLHLPALAPNLYLPALAPNLYLPTLAPNLCLPALAPNLYLPALATTLCLPQICIYRLSPIPEFAYTDLFSPICIYWLWPTFCKHTGC